MLSAQVSLTAPAQFSFAILKKVNKSQNKLILKSVAKVVVLVCTSVFRKTKMYQAKA